MKEAVAEVVCANIALTSSRYYCMCYYVTSWLLTRTHHTLTYNARLIVTLTHQHVLLFYKDTRWRHARLCHLT